MVHLENIWFLQEANKDPSLCECENYCSLYGGFIEDYAFCSKILFIFN